MRFLKLVCLAPALALAQSPPSDLNLPSTTVSSGNVTYSATNTITSGNTFLITSSGSVTFRAGTQILIGPGFHASGTASTVFHAIIGAISSVVITTTSLPAGTTGVCYSVPLTVAGGTSPYHNWAATGSLPPGLSLDSSTGVLSGTPSSASGSPFIVSVTVVDGANTTSPPQTLSIVVNTGSGVVAPAREYIRLGGRVIAIENATCTTQ